MRLRQIFLVLLVAVPALADGRVRGKAALKGRASAGSSYLVSSGNASIDAILGPMVRNGRNPWPWADQIVLTAAGVQQTQLTTFYSSGWETALAGTISMGAGSTTVTGSGTNFQVDFCGGSGNTSPVGHGDAHLIIWWPVSGGGYGKFDTRIISCDSPTQLTVYKPYNPLNKDPGPVSGWQYSRRYTSGTSYDAWFVLDRAPANYYDNVMSFARLYYTTADVQWLTAARTLALRWLTSPLWDRGTACITDNENDACLGTRRRSWAMTGLWWYFFDQGQPAWIATALRGISKYAQDYVTNNFFYSFYSFAQMDPREVGIAIQTIALCAQFDPDTTNRDACKASLVHTNLYGFLGNTRGTGASAGLWPLLIGNSDSSWGTDPGAGSTVTLTNDNPNVTLTGFSWSGLTADKSTIVFCGSSVVAKPDANHAGCDTAQYTIHTITDGTHVILDRKYAGTTGTHTWWLSNPYAGDVYPVGYGSESLMLGILGTGFYRSWQALNGDSRYTSQAAQYRDWMIDAATQLANNAYRGDHSSNYWVGPPGCNGLSVSPACFDSYFAARRGINPEVATPIMYTYQYNGSSALKTVLDEMFGGYFGKLGGPSTDGQYDEQWDLCCYLNQPAGQPDWAKWFGVPWGVTNFAAWPGIR